MFTLKPTVQAFDKSQIHLHTIVIAQKGCEKAVQSFLKMVVTFELSRCGHICTNYLSGYGEI